MNDEPQKTVKSFGRGGKRLGAGRKAAPDSEKKVVTTFNIKSRLVKLLRAEQSRSALIESLLEKHYSKQDH